MAWDAALKISKVKLQLFTEEDMYLFIESGIRGGISTITKRFAKANNDRIDGYNPEEDVSHLLYIDANNLYGWAMSQLLPTHNFRWMDPDEVDGIIERIQEIADDSELGYIFEVDLHYPQQLHDAHNGYPLAPEHLEITEDMLSPYQTSTYPTHRLRKTRKLAPNLYDKKNYIVHYRNLKYYLAMGMEVTRVHRVLEFNQSDWLKSYVDFNTEQRTLGTTDFEKSFFKLMNNSVFGE